MRLQLLVRAAGALMLAASAAACSAAGDHTDTYGPQNVLYRADYPSYTTADQLFERASVVVQGRVESAKKVVRLVQAAPQGQALPAAVDAERREGMVVTVRTVTVSRVFKGDVKPGDVVQVKQLGGKLDGVTYSEEHGVPLLDNGQYTLFLETYSDQPASLLNPVQAQYPVDAGNGLLSLPGNEITTSVTQLDRLAHK
ncbi:hypothetical protein DDE19_21390 [Micromonospora ureilytica]|uniref:DUF5666 domain-containing protein n=1 Tax=Micromonospora ureilytica TaxID=709868 RepID=A0A3N9XQF1_9ACTN|nr:hypothetical protein [Micromonospora ureilytica]RQX14992.1 hypothetical protein DDE19_21390 [Micromonospora ureilytica]WSG29608.1 hypothetical protein OHB55_18255 [Micromonospora ureilytica]